MKQLIRRHGHNHRFVLEAGRLVPKGADPIIPQEGIPVGGARLVYGSVDDDGNTVDPGSGDWECDFTGPNIYTFTVDPVFASDINNVVAGPTSNLAAGTGSDQAYFVGVDQDAAAPDTFVVLVWDLIGDADDGSFAFIAIETPA